MPEPEDPLEARLRGTMPRLDPPPGFAQGVAARAVAEPHFRRFHPRLPARRSRWVLVAVIAVCFTAVFAGRRFQQARHRRAQAEVAARQLQFAVQFTLNRIVSINHRALAGAIRSLPEHETPTETRD